MSTVFEQDAAAEQERAPAPPLREPAPPDDGQFEEPTRSVLATAVTITVALIAGLLLNSGAVVEATNIRPVGPARERALDVWEAVDAASSSVGLDRPRAWFDRARGADDESTTGITIPPTTALAVLGEQVERATTTTTEPNAPRIARTPTAADPLRLFVAGDSLVETYGTSQARLAADTGIMDPILEFRVGSGLIRPDYFDWPRYLRSQMLLHDPEAVVIMFGANDSQPIELADGAILETYSPEWEAAYRGIVGEVMDLLEDDDRIVFWVGVPGTRTAAFAERMAKLDVIYRSEAATREHVVFIDSWPLFVAPDGSYSHYLPAADGSERVMRQKDGLHFSTSGGNRLSWAVLDAMGLYIDLSNRVDAPPLDGIAPPEIAFEPLSGIPENTLEPMRVPATALPPVTTTTSTSTTSAIEPG